MKPTLLALAALLASFAITGCNCVAKGLSGAVDGAQQDYTQLKAFSGALVPAPNPAPADGNLLIKRMYPPPSLEK